MRSGKYLLKDLGMKRFTGIVEVVNESELIEECHKHLISMFVRVHWLDPSETKGMILAGIGRSAGEVEYVDEYIQRKLDDALWWIEQNYGKKKVELNPVSILKENSKLVAPHDEDTLVAAMRISEKKLGLEYDWEKYEHYKYLTRT